MANREWRAQRGAVLPGWAWLGMGLAVLLVLWAIVEVTTPEREVGVLRPNERVAGERQEIGGEDPNLAAGEPGADFVPLESITRQPVDYTGREVTVTGTFAGAATERAFWLERGDQRILIITEEASAEWPRMSAGQRVNLTGTVRSSAISRDLPSLVNVEDTTRELALSQPAFIELDSLAFGDTVPPGVRETPRPTF